VNDWIHRLPEVNASLNATATLLLVAGYIAIRRGNVTWHKRAMLTAFAASVVFLTCYVIYHWPGEDGRWRSVKFEGPPGVRMVYLCILLTHVVLAASVPVLALRTIYLGLQDRRAEHRRIARWTFPIWLYVSITGVVIYWMLYQLYPPAAGGSIMPP